MSIGIDLNRFRVSCAVKYKDLRNIETINPDSFSENETYIRLSIASCSDKYGIVDGNGHVICPCVCDSISFGMPYWIAEMQYKGLEFILDRHSSWGPFYSSKNGALLTILIYHVC